MRRGRSSRRLVGPTPCSCSEFRIVRFTVLWLIRLIGSVARNQRDHSHFTRSHRHCFVPSKCEPLLAKTWTNTIDHSGSQGSTSVASGLPHRSPGCTRCGCRYLQAQYPDLSDFRCWQIALSFSAFLQLAAFFTIMAVGLWIDRVSYDTTSAFAGHIRVYQAAFIVLAVVSTPVPGPVALAWLTTTFQIIAPWMISVWPFLSSSYILLTALSRAGGPSSERSDGLSSSLECSTHSSSLFGRRCSQVPSTDTFLRLGHSSPVFPSPVTCLWLRPLSWGLSAVCTLEGAWNISVRSFQSPFIPA